MFADIFFGSFALWFAIWGVRARFYPRRGQQRGHPGWTYEGWRRHVLRAIFLVIFASALIDLWYRLTGRGQFLH